MEATPLIRFGPEPAATGKKGEAARGVIRNMLNAGIELFGESLSYDPTGKRGLLRDINATEIAGRVGLTTGAFFHWWKTQGEYREALLNYILASLFQEAVDELEKNLPPPEEYSGRQAVGDLIGAAILKFLETQHEVKLALVSAHSDDRVKQGLREFYDALTARVEPILSEMLMAEGLRFKDHSLESHYITIVTAIADGLLLQEAAESPPYNPKENNKRRQLVQIAASRLIEQMTESG